MTLTERIERPGPKKLLAIDGGGIRGVLALEVLQKIEDAAQGGERPAPTSAWPTTSTTSPAPAPAASSRRVCRPACRSPTS